MHDMALYDDDVLYTVMHTPFEDDVDWSMYTVHAIEDDIYSNRYRPHDDVHIQWSVQVSWYI